jgi:hypothetical protein
MSIESGGGERNQELINRAVELLEKFQVMLQRNNGEYPPIGMAALNKKPPQEDLDVMEELGTFFEEDCESIPSVEVGPGGNYERDLLKRLSDTLWLLKEVHPEYDLDLKEYSMVGKERAMELLQSIIAERKKQIKVLEGKNEGATQLLNSLK